MFNNFQGPPSANIPQNLTVHTPVAPGQFTIPNTVPNQAVPPQFTVPTNTVLAQAAVQGEIGGVDPPKYMDTQANFPDV